MKKKVKALGWGAILGTSFASGGGAWASSVPVAVSPGDAAGASIAGACPTLSWAHVQERSGLVLLVRAPGRVQSLARTICRVTIAVLAVATLAEARSGASALAAATPPADLVVLGATVIDGTGAPPRSDTAIVIRDGRIAVIGPREGVRIPEGARILDAAGKYVIPGLADMHVHFGLGAPLPRRPDETERVLARQLYYGVTTILQLGATDGSTDAILALRERREAGSLRSPHLYGTGGHLTLPGTHPVYTIFPPSVRKIADELAAGTPRDEPVDLYPLGLGISFVRTEEAARKAVRERAKGGMDAIKITVESGPTPFGDDHPQMSVAMIRTIVEEAAHHGLPVFAHVSSRDELEATLEGGAAGVVHAPQNEPLPDAELAAEMARRRFFVVPTLSLFADPPDRSDPFLRVTVSEDEISALWRPEFLARVRPRWDCCAPFEELLGTIAMYREHGVPLVVGTDTGNPYVFPGYSVHREMELLVRAGLTPGEALAAATRVAAEMIGAEEDFGTIETGKRADLLILGANPLDDIRHTRSIEVVISEGEVIDRDALSELLPAAEERGVAPGVGQPSGSETVGPETSSPPILDMHLHARHAPSPGRALPSKLCLPVSVYGVVDPQCSNPLVSPATDEEMIARTVEILERRNVYGVISDDELELVRRFRAAAPGRLLPAYELDLDGDDLSPEALRDHFAAGDFAVLGEVAPQYQGIAPDDPRLEPYWALAEELDIPVALHLGEGYPGAPYLGDPDYRVRFGSPLLLEEVLVRHPKLRLYVMHYGSPLVDEMIAVMMTYPNVYIEIGGNTWPYPREYFYSQLERFVDAGFGNRILFGSDQMRWPELIELSIEIVEEAPFLTEQQKRDILYWNAARFMRLSDEEIARHHGGN